MSALALEKRTDTPPPPAHDRVLYTEFFGLRTLPFTLTPDPDFFFSHPASQDALNKLLFATRTGEGFVKVTGEVGTGKTLLCRAFLGMLGKEFITAYVPNPYMDPLTLLLAIADELGVTYPNRPNQHELLKVLTEFFITSYARHGKTVVICLDEAHALPRASLEVLRLLSNLETAKRKLLHLVLFGQPELNEQLEQRSIRQLRQRISFSAQLNALNTNEVQDYVMHRLSIAGYQGPRPFSEGAMRLLARVSRGVPRLINILAHKSLIAAYADGVRYITTKHVALAIEDTDSLDTTHHKQSVWQRHSGYLFLLLTGSLATAVAALSYRLMQLSG